MPPDEVLARVGAWAARHASDGGAAGLAERLGRWVAFTLEAAGRMNLTADREPELFWRRHVEDALAAAEQLEAALGLDPAAPQGPGRVLDVGSGAGLPGLAWALLWPGARVDLLDARQKRVGFLNDAIAHLGLTGRVATFCGRAETLGRQALLREQYDVVAARALAPLPVLLELTLPFARVGGVVAAIKAAGVQEEARQALRALRRLGGGDAGAIQALPYARGDGKACALCLARKLAPTPPQYPRREGIPERKPL
jgi:16S rRNA (guanine527-N7)-methyltransferase